MTCGGGVQCGVRCPVWCEVGVMVRVVSVMTFRVCDCHESSSRNVRQASSL